MTQTSNDTLLAASDYSYLDGENPIPAGYSLDAGFNAGGAIGGGILIDSNSVPFGSGHICF